LEQRRKGTYHNFPELMGSDRERRTATGGGSSILFISLTSQKCKLLLREKKRCATSRRQTAGKKPLDTEEKYCEGEGGYHLLPLANR